MEDKQRLIYWTLVCFINFLLLLFWGVRVCSEKGSCNNVRHALATQTCYITPFKKLQMLSASLDLNNIREAIILSYFFQECSGLQHLRICSPVSVSTWESEVAWWCSNSYYVCYMIPLSSPSPSRKKRNIIIAEKFPSKRDKRSGSPLLSSTLWFQVENLDKLNQDSGNHLSYPDYLFWQRKETFFSIEKNLNAVWVKRFGGREIEMEFAKYIITRAPKMKSMIIECVDNCTADALSLLNLPRASKDLSLVLKHPSLSSGTSGCEWTCPSIIQWGHLEYHHDGFEKWPFRF